MVSWILIVILVALFLIFVRLKSMRHKFFAITLIVIIIFIYITSSRLLAENNISLNSFNGIVSGGKLYLGWLLNAFSNLKVLTGNVIKMDWVGDINKPANFSVGK